MTTPSPHDLGAPPAALLSDGLVELRLLRVMGAHNAQSRPPDARFLGHVPECRFAIHRRRDGLRVGRIHIRVTREERIVHSIGHAGYAVDDEHRRNGYATRAIRLIVGLARYWDVLPLWVLIEPENVASRRAVERAGFELVDEVDSSSEIMALGMGPAVCRYRIAS
jgi:predicted acetyltransferase